MNVHDVEAAERAEASIDAFILKRSASQEKANKLEEAWAESTRRVNEKRRRANRWAWISHHGRMHSLHQALASEHADKRARLMAEVGFERDDEPDETPGPEAA